MIPRALLFMLLAACAAAAKPASRENWTLLVEIYTLPESSAQLGEIFDVRGNLLPGVEAAQARERARAWHAAGSAEMHGLQALTMQPGDRSRVIGHDEVLRPDEILPSRVPGAPPYPASLSDSGFGTVFSIAKKEHPASGGGPPSFSLELRERWRSRFSEGYGYAGPNRTKPDYRDGWMEIEASHDWLPPRVELLHSRGSLANWDRPTVRKTIVSFLQINHRELPPLPAVQVRQTFQCAWTIVSVDHQTAVRIVSAETAWSAARAALDQGSARIEKILSLETISGQAATAQEGTTLHGTPQLTAPQYRRLPRRDAKGDALANAPHLPATATAFAQRDPVSTDWRKSQTVEKDDDEKYRTAGWSVLYCEPVRTADALTIKSKIGYIVPSGDLRDPHLPSHFPPLSIVEARKLETTVAVSAEPVLLGTLNPPPPNGVNDRTDDGRTWLVFLAAKPTPP